MNHFLHFTDTEDGYVQISGFTDDAPDMVTKKLKVGDRIIAVDSSIGSNMWPVSHVEGVVSAVTTRLPGQPVQVRFERVVEEGIDLSKIESLAGAKGKAKVGASGETLTKSLLGTYSKFSAKTDVVQSKDLLSRCRSVLNRYISVYDPQSERSKGVPGLVADRVMESLAEASASLDAKTLSLVMNAYITCNQPKDALKAFEVAVGLKADGSSGTPDAKIQAKKAKNSVVTSLSGLHLYTATDVIRAHALLGDSFAARRVLAAIQGGIASFDGVPSFSWGGKIRADTKCYNAVLTAVVNTNDIEAAEEMFNRMCDPDRFPTAQPKKNLATYNTMIGMYARCGRRQEAFEVFRSMKTTGTKPDKFTITALIKAVVADGDFETARNLLRDMKKAGIDADVVAYNTVIRELCQRSAWFEAKELVAEMESSGVNPDSKTYGLLMNGLLKLRKPGPCLTLFESACSDQRTAGLMENVKLYTTAITAAASMGDYERAFELVSRMNFAGVKPNMKTLTALMGACVSADKHEFALDVYKKMKSPDGYALTLALRAHSGLGDVDKALSMMQSSDILSGKQIMLSYNYMFGTALGKRDYESAQKIMVCSHVLHRIFCDNLNFFGTNSSVRPLPG